MPSRSLNKVCSCHRALPALEPAFLPYAWQSWPLWDGVVAGGHDDKVVPLRGRLARVLDIIFPNID